MKLFILNSAYPSYLQRFYAARPYLERCSYVENKEALDYDAFGWADFWSQALAPYGCEVMETTVNAGPMQKAWAAENGVKYTGSRWLSEIVMAQLNCFRPDIIWYNHSDSFLLDEIKYAVSSVRLVLGWVGSAFKSVPQGIDLVLSCAPESVDRLRMKGYRAYHINHGFEERILGRMQNRKKEFDVSFVGQIVRSNQFHTMREKILKSIAREHEVQIFSPSAEFTLKDYCVTIAKKVIFWSVQGGIKAGVPKKILEKIPVLGRAARWNEAPLMPVDLQLRPLIKPPLFGLEMYQALKDSRVTLNIHADSSPTHASNMRLFEATGVGTCLVTDWKENIPRLFEPDRELITYKSAGECIEKIKWLLEHPDEREAIARAGQARTLKDHTYARRGEQLFEIIRKEM